MSSMIRSGSYRVTITVVDGRELVDIHTLDEAPLAYAKLRWRGEKQKTGVRRPNQGRHDWSEGFEILWRAGTKDDVAVIEIWSSHIFGRNRIIGIVPLSLNSLRVGAVSDGVYPLCEPVGTQTKPPGAIRLVVQIMPLHPGSPTESKSPERSLPAPGSPTTGNRPSEKSIQEMVFEIQSTMPQMSPQRIKKALQENKFDEEKAISELHLALLDIASGQSLVADSPPRKRKDEGVALLFASSSEDDDEEDEDEDEDDEETNNDETEGSEEAPEDTGEETRARSSRRRKAKKRRARRQRKYAESGGRSPRPDPSKVPMSKSAEEKLQELLPYCSLERIQDALKRHNFNANAAMNELLDIRIHEVGQTIMAQNLHKTGMLQLQMAPDLNKTFQNFFIEGPPPTPEPEESPPQLISPDLPVGVTIAPSVSTSPDAYIRDTGRRRALLIGINYLGSKKELKGCIQDVHRMKTLITQVYGFPDDAATITTLTDDSRNPVYLPTKKNILLAMKWLVNGARPGDVLFFHFSGHGGQKRNLKGTEADGLDETIMPLDYRTTGHILDDDLFDLLIAPLKSGVKLTAVMDCCHSGSGMDLPFIWNPTKRHWDTEMFPKFAAGDVQLFAGCSDDETSADLYIPSQESGGAMTFALRSALSANPFNHSYPSLMDQVDSSLRSWGFPQRPQLSSSQKFTFDRGFSLTIIVPNTNPLLGRPAKDEKRRPDVPSYSPNFLSPNRQMRPNSRPSRGRDVTSQVSSSLSSLKTDNSNSYPSQTADRFYRTPASQTQTYSSSSSPERHKSSSTPSAHPSYPQQQLYQAAQQPGLYQGSLGSGNQAIGLQWQQNQQSGGAYTAAGGGGAGYQETAAGGGAQPAAWTYGYSQVPQSNGLGSGGGVSIGGAYHQQPPLSATPGVAYPPIQQAQQQQYQQQFGYYSQPASGQQQQQAWGGYQSAGQPSGNKKTGEYNPYL